MTTLQLFHFLTTFKIWLFYIIFTISSGNVHVLFMTCSWNVHRLITIWSWLVCYLLIICYDFYYNVCNFMNSLELLHLHFFSWPISVPYTISLKLLYSNYPLWLLYLIYFNRILHLNVFIHTTSSIELLHFIYQTFLNLPKITNLIG